jgi:hypothetical protein
MQPENVRVRALFDDERTYKIPLYQRDYAWTKDDQWELLFDDLANISDRLGTPQAKPHFLGAIVIQQDKQTAASLGRINQFAVIDGQQRLTTLQLLLRGILDVANDLDRQSSTAKVLTSLIRNSSYKVSGEADQYKLAPRNKAIWRTAMEDAVPATQEHPYHAARGYFAERARAYVSGSPARLDALVNGLLLEFRVVNIPLEADDDAQMIFEVLNGRQMRLTASDLVKNLIFMSAERANQPVNELYERHWAELEHKWWDTPLGTGHAARPRRDILISCWLATATRREVNIEDLYGEVRRYIRDNPHRDAPSILQEISSLASAFRRVVAQEGTLPSAISEGYSRIVRLKVTTALPLLAWLEAQPIAKLPLEQRAKAVHAVESWLLRRLICGMNTRSYAKYFVQILDAAMRADDAGMPVGEAVVETLSNAQDDMAWPSDDLVKHQVRAQPMYETMAKDRIVLLLSAIDSVIARERRKSDPITVEYRKLHVEHILPQTWRDNWKIPEAPNASDIAKMRDVVKHQLGNLTLATPSLNSALSNLPWTEKRDAIRKHSLLPMNLAIVQQDEWNEATIAARGDDLAQKICNIWTGPSQPIPQLVTPEEHEMATQEPEEAEESEDGSKAERQRRRLEFWTDFALFMEERYPDQPRPEPRPARSLRLGTYKPHIAVNVRVSLSSRSAEIELNFHKPDSVALLQRSKERLPKFEEILGEKLVQPPQENLNRARLLLKRQLADFSPEERAEGYEWLGRQLKALHKEVLPNLVAHA